jgi:O-antigen ligase
MRRSSRAELCLAVTVLLFAASMPLSIAVSQGLLALAFLAWLVLPRGRRVFSVKLLLAGAAYSAWTWLAAGLSDAPLLSLEDSRDMLLFLVLLVVPPAVRVVGSDSLRVALLTGATIASSWGLLDYASTQGGLLNRSSGPYGHYMTYGGVLMLVLSAVLAELMVRGVAALSRADVLARALPVPLIAGALAISYARSAWLGFAAALMLMVVVVRPRWAWLVPVLAVATLVAAPQGIRSRLLSIVDFTQDASSMERIYMAHAGLQMIRSHPVLGLGPGRLPAHYPQYRHPDAPDRRPAHLHSNPIQIAAERGLPGLAAWLALLVLAVWDAASDWRAGRDRASALGAIAAVAALFVAGLFEYNFGDSEVSMLFLCLIALPQGPPRGDSQ